jgi:hypothetical protein
MDDAREDGVCERRGLVSGEVKDLAARLLMAELSREFRMAAGVDRNPLNDVIWLHDIKRAVERYINQSQFIT